MKNMLVSPWAWRVRILVLCFTATMAIHAPKLVPVLFGQNVHKAEVQKTFDTCMQAWEDVRALPKTTGTYEFKMITDLVTGRLVRLRMQLQAVTKQKKLYANDQEYLRRLVVKMEQEYKKNRVEVYQPIIELLNNITNILNKGVSYED